MHANALAGTGERERGGDAGDAAADDLHVGRSVERPGAQVGATSASQKESATGDADDDATALRRMRSSLGRSRSARPGLDGRLRPVVRFHAQAVTDATSIGNALILRPPELQPTPETDVPHGINHLAGGPIDTVLLPHGTGQLELGQGDGELTRGEAGCARDLVRACGPWRIRSSTAAAVAPSSGSTAAGTTNP